MEEDPQSFDQAIDQITKILNGSNVHFGHGAPEAPSEALWLIAYCAGISPVQALDHLDESYDTASYAQALKIVEERINTRTPLAYLLKEAWLMGHCFECDERSIIPRSFIAELITQGDLDDFLPPDGKALDLCTGNGSLAILLSLNYPDIQVCASDIDLNALALAQKNILNYELSEVIEIIHSDLWHDLPEPNEENRFDLIVCNPPYVNQTTMQKLPAEYLKEPWLALDGGEDGMSLIRKIIQDAKSFLNERGAIVIEIGNEYDNFINAFPELEVQWLEVSSSNRQVLLILEENLPQ